MVRKMDKLLIQYILFTYAPDPQIVATDPFVAALTLQLPDGQTPRLNVYTRPGWDKNCEPGERLRVTRATLSEWETYDPAEGKALFHVLAHNSMSALVPLKRGTCTENELKELLAKELQIDISSQ